MRCSWNRLLGISLVFVVTLKTIHILLLRRVRSQFTKEEVVKGYVIDGSGEYVILTNFISSRTFPHGDDVSLVTHASVNKIWRIQELAQRWQGPLSVTLLVEDRNSLLELLRKRKCWEGWTPELSSSILDFSFHLVYPVSMVSVTEDFHWSCHFDDFTSDWSFLPTVERDRQNYAHPVSYPNNLLRNVGRAGANTEWIFVVDIDMVPSCNLHSSLVDFLSRRSEENVVFVVPAFELDTDHSSETVPCAKKEVLDMWSRGILRPFYQEPCSHCQNQTDYERWREFRSPDSEIRAAYRVEWRDPWEPFYVGRNSVPSYDERFRQYGFNRISQVCEVFVAGYEFEILDNAFLVHLGFKISEGFHASKSVEQERNRKLFRRFKDFLREKYPLASRVC